MANFCYNCGNKLSSVNRVCPTCGAQNIYAEPHPNVHHVYIMSQPPVCKVGTGLGSASLVLGILSLVFLCFFPLSGILALISFPLGLAGIFKSKKNGLSSGSSVGGVVCSSIALTIVFMLVLVFSKKYNVIL